MKRIFLMGYMGVGKTTTGRELARILGLEFIDLDHFIQNRYNKTITQIFEEEGETRFREIENSVLKEISTFENILVSTGGGTPCFFDNISIMNEAGLTVYLKASPALLAERLNACKDKRPLIKDKNSEELLQFVSDNLVNRHPYYSQAQIVFESEELVNKSDIEKYVSKLIEHIELNRVK